MDILSHEMCDKIDVTWLHCWREATSIETASESTFLPFLIPCVSLFPVSIVMPSLH